MDYTDLQEITETLTALVQTAITTAGWPASVEVLPEVPRDDKTGVGLYLYHVQENQYYKNYASQGIDTPPVSYTPMSLNLFYILSASSRDAAGDQDAMDEQGLMSVAMKTLHDNPVLRKTLPSPAFPLGKDIDIKITFQILSPSDAVQYWASSQSPVRLAAYYEVSVVFLPPEAVKSYPGRVLTYGNYVFVQGAPQITGCQNTIQFISPVDLTTVTINVQPAQAPPAAAIPAPAESIVSFFGNGFGGGTLKILLYSPLWPELAETDATWSVSRISETQANMAVQPTAKLVTSGTVVDILPGLYGAQLNRSEVKTLPNGTSKTFSHSSNQFPFSIAPRVDSVITLTPTQFRIQGSRYQHADIKDDDIQIYTADIRLDLVGGGALAPGQFKLIAFDTIDLHVPASIHGPQVPLRIMIRGIESAPRWISVP